MIGRAGRLGVAVAVFLLGLAPGTASAVSVLKSFQGSDYSINTSDGHTVSSRDLENDGHDVSGDWVQIGSSAENHVIDQYGGGCSAASLGSAVVYKHRAVELLPLTDAYGGRVFPQ